MHSTLLLTCAICISQAPAASRETAAGAVAARIDQFTATYWRQQGIAPAEQTTDAEFVRRVTLDLIGRVPTAGEAATFAADGAADKRARLITRLMDGPEFAHHFGAVL